jgi:branched-chain amino acid transport system substrate-binding protein
MQTTIGILLPRSTYYETIGFDLFNGLKNATKELGLSENIRIVTENIGFGADKQQCYRSAERLLLEENAAIVFAYMGHRGAQLLRPLFLAMNRLLIVLDAGANLPHESELCPNIIYHSFHNSLGAWLSSQRAVADGFKQGGMITGYYDGGYLHTVALTEGFTRAGGQIAFNVATGYKAETFSMEDTVPHLEANPKSALLTLFSGDFIQWYFRELVRVHGEKNLPLYLSPFGMEERMLEEAVYPGDHARGVVVWSRELKNAENERFNKVIQENTEKKTNIFSLFGWEAAQLLKTLLDLQTQTGLKMTDPELLKKIEFESPRGTVRLDEKLNTTYGPMYFARIVPTDRNTCQLQIEGSVEHVKEALDSLSAISLNGVETAWYNSYVCI